MNSLLDWNEPAKSFDNWFKKAPMVLKFIRPTPTRILVSQSDTVSTFVLGSR